MALGAVAGSHFDVRGFCKRYALKRDLISRMTSYAPRTVADWVAGKPIRGAALLKITELTRLTNALEKLVEPESIGPWFQTPNQSTRGAWRIRSTLAHDSSPRIGPARLSAGLRPALRAFIAGKVGRGLIQKTEYRRAFFVP